MPVYKSFEVMLEIVPVVRCLVQLDINCILFDSEEGKELSLLFTTFFIFFPYCVFL